MIDVLDRVAALGIAAELGEVFAAAFDDGGAGSGGGSALYGMDGRMPVDH